MSNTLIKALAAGSVATGLLLSGCSSAGTSATTGIANCTPVHSGVTTITGGQLTISGSEFAPFVTFADSATAPTGIDTEIVGAIAAMECLTTQYTQTTYKGAIDEVTSGRADVAVGDYYRTTKRAEVVDLSDAMYNDGMGLISKDGVSDLATVFTRKVGTVSGYLWNDDMQKVMGDSLKVYQSNVEMWADLKSGRIDVGIDSIPVSKLHAKDNPGWQIVTAQADSRIAASVKPSQAGLPYTKGNTSLGTALNEDIATLHSNGKLKEIFTKYNVDPKDTEVTENYLT